MEGENETLRAHYVRERSPVRAIFARPAASFLARSDTQG